MKTCVAYGFRIAILFFAAAPAGSVFAEDPVQPAVSPAPPAPEDSGEAPVVEQSYEAELEVEKVLIELPVASNQSDTLTMFQVEVARYEEGEPIPPHLRKAAMLLYPGSGAQTASAKCSAVELRADKQSLRPARTLWTQLDGDLVIAIFPLGSLDALGRAQTITGRLCQDTFELDKDAPRSFAALAKEGRGDPIVVDPDPPVADQATDPDTGEEFVKVTPPIADDPTARGQVSLEARVVRGNSEALRPLAGRSLDLILYVDGDTKTTSPKCYNVEFKTDRLVLRPTRVAWETRDEGRVVANFPLSALDALSHAKWVRGSVCRDHFALGQGFRRLLRALAQEASQAPWDGNQSGRTNDEEGKK